jgi:hypothetical protein
MKQIGSFFNSFKYERGKTHLNEETYLIQSKYYHEKEELLINICLFFIYTNLLFVGKFVEFRVVQINSTLYFILDQD